MDTIPKQLLNETKIIRKLAQIVRKTVEVIADYESKNHCIDGNDERTLAGYCARASALLSTALMREGIKHTISGGCGHFFIMWEGNIVDVTATQFGEQFPKTMIRSKESIIIIAGHYNEGFWKPAENFCSCEELWAWQNKLEWPDEQISRVYDLKFLDELKEYKDFCNGDRELQTV